MGFVAKSAFWLGMVYSAMPFDSGSPVALAPAAADKPRAEDLSLGNIANSVIPSLGQTQDRWKSAVEVAAALCAHNCFHPSPAGLSLIARPLSREKSDRQGAVRPPTANHIRSLDGQT